MAEHQARKLHVRVFGGIGVKVATAFLQLLAIPVIISQAGLEIYGLFGVFSIVIIYFAMADLGITKSTLRFVSMSQSGDLTTIFSVVFVLTTIFSLLIVGIGLFLSDFVLQVMSVEATTANFTIYFLALVTSTLLVARSLYLSAAYALEQFRFAYNTVVVFDLLRWCSTIAAITLLDDALLALIAVFAIATLSHVIALAYVVHVRHGIRIRLPLDGNVAKEIFQYSISVFIIDMMNKISSYADKILVASTGAVLNFAQYYIAFQVVGKISDFLSAATIPYMQSVAKHFGAGNSPAIRGTVTGAFHTMGRLFLPLILSLLIFGKTYLTIWLGLSTAEDVYPYLALLSAGYTLSIYGTVSINLANALGQTSVAVLSGGFMAVAIIVGGFLVLPSYGPLGVSAVWAATQAIPLIVVFPPMMRSLGISRARLLFGTFATIVGIGVVFLAAKISAHALLEEPTPYEMLAFALGSLSLSYAPTVLPLLLRRM